MIINRFLGFEFVKVAVFDLSEHPYTYIKNQKTKTENTWATPTRINFFDEAYVDAGQSAYLVCGGTEYQPEDILYVGEYSASLKERWLRLHAQGEVREWLVWHSDNLADGLNRLLKDEPDREISLWLTVDPFVEGPSGKINISYTIEQAFLQQKAQEYPLRFNKKGRTKAVAPTVAEIIADLKSS
ncbi:MAG: hypothetical protein HWE08_04915 [Alphaproteobacteria bacterium]|nr:hypothetical protein [Alphaproteobacteria bacterium]